MLLRALPHVTPLPSPLLSNQFPSTLIAKRRHCEQGLGEALLRFGISNTSKLHGALCFSYHCARFTKPARVTG